MCPRSGHSTQCADAGRQVCQDQPATAAVLQKLDGHSCAHQGLSPARLCLRLAGIKALRCMLQGMSRQQFEAIQPDTGRMLAASTDGSIFAVALTVQADNEGATSLQLCLLADGR